MKNQAIALLAASFLGAAAIALDDDTPAKKLRAELAYNGTSTLILQVEDLEASMNWYRDTLGFEPLWSMDELNFGELQSSVHGLQIGISEVPEPKAGGTAVTFGVLDIESARARLERAGVKFDGDTVLHEGLVKLAYFKDPNGNQLVLHQSLSSPTADAKK